ncbi:hypothetical protein ILUMI_07440, partial [Ignelater luminosus]
MLENRRAQLTCLRSLQLILTAVARLRVHKEFRESSLVRLQPLVGLVKRSADLLAGLCVSVEAVGVGS